ncbi:LacI family DNA-binding transcriptional regulator [Streptomyces sp. RFCAC02]|uniref:LacI family DNA-binding transcriptional regulator n=1 Tax=Streptomyces sp. RFCAC02 TaxID=2499143 RepID=UPI0010214916|nr:LacI family DNA-binding transcriptional regulator [Streptomyces sp. RFCAC02]
MAPRSRRPGQRDIARVAGVSQATVSIVLNGKAEQYHLARETQERVRAAIAELGYVPDVAGRSLRDGRNGLIGVHTYESVFPVALEDYYHEFLVGIEQAAVRARRDLVLFASTERDDGVRRIYGPEGNRLRLADGSVMLGHEQSSEELAKLAGEGYPFVFVGRREVPGAQVPYVTADYAAATRAVVDAVADAGHPRVAYLGRIGRFTPQEERHAAFVTRCRERELPVAPLDFVDASAVGTALLGSLLESGVTALVVETPELAAALADAVERLGVRVPDDLSVAVLDHTSGPAAAWSRLDVPRRAMGVRAVELLLALLDGEITPDHREVVPCGPFAPLTVAAPPAR